MFSSACAEGCDHHRCRLLCICRECECDKGRGDTYEVHYCHDYYSGAAVVHWQVLAIAMATYIMYNYRDRSDGFVFAFGTFIGGAYEYICSVFTEIVFGKIFWDYLGLPFNLGGRINLLYCFFWGIATVVDKISNQMILKRLTMYFIIPTGDFSLFYLLYSVFNSSERIPFLLIGITPFTYLELLRLLTPYF